MATADENVRQGIADVGGDFRDVRNYLIADIEFTYQKAQQLDNIVADAGNSNAENVAARTDITGETYKTIGDRMDDQSLKIIKKIDEGNVTVADIDKNKGKFDQTYMTDEFLQQLAGTTPINATPADRSVTRQKVALKAIGPAEVSGTEVINVFDPSKSTDKYRLAGFTSTDIAADRKDADAAWVISDFIPVSVGESYTVDQTSSVANSVVARLYKSDKTPIRNINNPSANVGTTFTISDSTAAYMRVNLVVNTIPKEQKMIAVGSIYPKEFTPYLKSRIDWLIVDQQPVGLEGLKEDVLEKIEGPIEKERIQGVTQLAGSQNLLNPETVTVGKRLAKSSSFPAGGEVIATDANWAYSDYIPATRGQVFTSLGNYSQNAVIAMIYDANKKPIDALMETNTAYASPRTITLPDNSAIAYVRFNMVIQRTPVNQQMIVEGTTYPSSYIPYSGEKFTINWFSLTDESVTESNLDKSLRQSLAKKDIRSFYMPRYVYGVTNKKMRVFYESVISAPDLNSLFFKSTFREGLYKVRDDHFVFAAPSTAAVQGDTVYMHDSKTGELVDSATFTRIFSDPATLNNPIEIVNILFAGDSFVAEGTQVEELFNHLVNINGWTNYNFIGQKTSNGVRHQGMGGYGIHDFVIPPSEMRPEFSSNPYYNPTTQKLDFNYYMSSNGFTGDIDYLILHFGVNDLLAYGRSPEQIVADIQTFLTQLFKDFPNCQVLICGLVPASDLNDQYSTYMHNESVRKINQAYDDFAETGAFKDNVTFVPVSAGFDTKHAYPYVMQPAYRNSTEQVKVLTDYLHPYEPGYCMEADQIYAAFLSIIK